MNGFRRLPTVGLRALAALTLTIALGTPGAHGASTKSRYSLVHGCFSLESPGGEKIAKAGNGYSLGGGSAETFRMQATELGTYLLYGRGEDFLGAGSGQTITVTKTPSVATEWVVKKADGSAFTLTNKGNGGGKVRTVATVPRSASSSGEVLANLKLAR